MKRLMHVLLLGALLSPAAASAQTYFLLESKIGGFLDVSNASPAAGSLLQVWNMVAGDNQLWTFIGGPSGTLYFQSRMGRYLDVQWANPARGAPTWIWDFNGGPAQRWVLEPSGETGWYYLRSALGTYLDVRGHTMANGLPVQTWSFNGFYTQKWKIVPPTRVVPPAIGQMCPHGGVDDGAEFRGSPHIRATVDVGPSPDRARLVARITYWADAHAGAVPCADPGRSDCYGQAHGAWQQTLYTAPAGRHVINVASSMRHSEVDFWGPSAGGEFLGCNDGEILTVAPAGGPVRQFLIIGDTGGGDVSNDDDCTCDTQIRRIDMQPLQVYLD